VTGYQHPQLPEKTLVQIPGSGDEVDRGAELLIAEPALMFSPTLEPSTDPDADQPYQRPAYASQQSHRHTLAPWARRRCKPEARVVSECGVERTVSWEVSVTVDRLPAELLTCASRRTVCK